jgi:hypothetical protein
MMGHLLTRPPVRLVRSLALLLALGAPSLLTAQVRGVSVTAPAAPAGTRTATPAVPVHLLPPAGKCRVWMEEVPATQQPAPTDCATALRLKPANAVVLYGPPLREEDEAFERATPTTSRPAVRAADEAARTRRPPAKASAGAAAPPPTKSAAPSSPRPPAERRP